MSTHSMDNHLNFRISSHDKRIIEAAAKLKGFKPQTYGCQKMIEAAERDIAEMSLLQPLLLNSTDWEFFLKTMNAPLQINQNLKKAVKNFKKHFGAECN